MKITSAPAAVVERDLPRGPAAGRPARSDRAAAPAQPTTTPADDAPEGAGPVRRAPPGLQKVLARLEAMGAEGRSPGQNVALERIARNLQRYLETQGLAPTPAPAPAPATDPMPVGTDATDAADADPAAPVAAETPPAAGDAEPEPPVALDLVA